MTEPLERRPRELVKNDGRTTHGVFVTSKDALKLRLRAVQRLADRLFKAMPWLSEADRPTMRSWAELEIVTSDCFNNLMREGTLQKDGSGEPRRLLKDYRQLKMTQLAYERELLMTPSSRAAVLGKDGGTPVDLLAHFAKTVTPDKDNGETETE
jgi:hypothetical protein